MALMNAVEIAEGHGAADAVGAGTAARLARTCGAGVRRAVDADGVVPTGSLTGAQRALHDVALTCRGAARDALCVDLAGPAAVARAKIEYVPEPGSTVSKYSSAERSRISEYDKPNLRSCGSAGGS